jgi:hypothetical protein
MRLYFQITALGLLVAALCSAPLAWDGAVYLFHLLDDQAPFVPHARIVNEPLQLPVLLLSRVTGNLTLLTLAFSAIYVSIPLLALALSWWAVRTRAPSLFVWPALGIGLGTLPGQFMFVSEANLAVQLFWPIGLAILTGLERRTLPLVAVLSPVILFSHPIGVPLLIGAAVLAGLLAVWVGRPQRGRSAAETTDLGTRLWLATGSFTVLAGLAVVRFAVTRTSYESDQLSPEVLGWTFGVAVAGPPLVALVLSWLAGLTLLMPDRVGQGRAVRLVGLLSLLGAAVTLLAWAADGARWTWALKFVYWAPLASLSFLGLATVDLLAHRAPGSGGRSPAWRWPHRLRTARLAASAFALVLIVQSTVWADLKDRLGVALQQSEWSCVSMPALGWIEQTPLNSFATPSLSILLQGRMPERLALAGNACSTATFAEALPLDPFTTRPWDAGWFNLRALSRRLVAEQTEPRGSCWFGLTSGWHPIEVNHPYWWHWSDDQDSSLKVVLDAPGSVTFSGRIESAHPDNLVRVVVNGEPAAALPVTQTSLQPFEPLTVPLEAGVNVIELVSQQPPVEIEGRPIDIGVANLSLAYGQPDVASDQPGVACHFRP